MLGINTYLIFNTSTHPRTLQTRLASQEAKCEDLEHEVHQLQQQLRDAEQTITASRVRREFAEKSAESIKELHRAEVAKRTEAQQVAVSEGNLRREAEAQLRESTAIHKKLQTQWQVEQAARREEVDRLTVSQWLAEQLLQVEVAAERESHRTRSLRLREERDAMQYRLGELTRRITILPEIYQQRIFGSAELPEDANFLDLVTGVDGDEPSLADGCRTQ